jgi:hypothetical protein
LENENFETLHYFRSEKKIVCAPNKLQSKEMKLQEWAGIFLNSFGF